MQRQLLLSIEVMLKLLNPCADWREVYSMEELTFFVQGKARDAVVICVMGQLGVEDKGSLEVAGLQELLIVLRLGWCDENARP